MNNLEVLNERRNLSFIGVYIPNINFRQEGIEEELSEIMKKGSNKEKYKELIRKYGVKNLENLTKKKLYDLFIDINEVVHELSLSKPKPKETLKIAKLVKKAVLEICD